jgi:hypothetical protein
MKNKQSSLEEVSVEALVSVTGGRSPGDYNIPPGWPGLPAGVGPKRKPVYAARPGVRRPKRHRY